MKGKIVGSEFAKAKAENIQEGATLVLTHEPENKYDELALAVSFEGERIGYVGKGTDLYDVPREYFPKKATVMDFYRKDEDDERYKGHETGNIVSCSFKVQDLQAIKMEDDLDSFNEKGVVINFNEESHTYTYDGKILKGATTFIKRYLEPFNSDFMVANCARAWKIEPSLIRKAWKLAGDLARPFGTGIHKAIEFEDLYAKYNKPKDGSRCFQIKNPAISNIVKEFFELYDRLEIQGEVVPEALVSDVENGICGLADRIIVKNWGQKICEIMDYKVNHSFGKKGQEKIINMPEEIRLDGNKLSKLALQLNFHQRMLEKSGWTVTGLHGMVYTDKWEYYEVTELPGFNILTGKMQKL